MTLAALEMHLADAMAERLTALMAEDGEAVFAAVLSALDTAALTAWPNDPPPSNWSTLRLWNGKRRTDDGKEALQARGDREPAAAG